MGSILAFKVETTFSTEAILKTPSWLPTFLRVLGVVLTILIVAALLRTIRRDWPAALEAWRNAEINTSWIIIAVAMGLIAHLFYAVGWWRLLVDCGVKITFLQTLRVYLISDLGRYLPGGKAWQTSIAAVMAAQQNLSAATVAATSLVQGSVGLAVGAALLLPAGDITLPVNILWLIIPLVAIVALIAAPALLKSNPSIRARLVKRIPRIDKITTRTMWMLVWTTGASWIAWGIGLHALAIGLLGDAGASPATYVAAWIGAYLAGVIALFTPAGLGVREETMRTILTASGLGAGGAVVVVVVARLWTFALDVVPALIVLALRPPRKRGSGNGGQGSGNGDQGSGNGGQRSGNGEQGSGNGEQGSGNGDRGSGVGERNKYGNRAPRKKGQRERTRM